MAANGSERASIDREVAGLTVAHVLERNARDYPDEPALSVKREGSWKTTSWRAYRDQVAEVARGLADLGVGPGDFVAIQARNIPEHLIADLGIVHTGAVPVSIYNTLSPDQVAYIAGHCKAKVAIVENADFLERWEKVRSELPHLQKVIVMDGSGGDHSWDDVVDAGATALAREGRGVFEEAWQRIDPQDPATLIYTSGTTGPPKGVILTHYNAVWTAASLKRWNRAPRGERYLSYLPLAHSAERMGSHYSGLWHVQHTYFCPEILQVFEFVPQVRPEAFVGVPRVWEKVAAAIRAGLAAEPNERKRKIGSAALDAGLEAARLSAEGKPIPLGLRVKRLAFEPLVYRKIRAKIGLDACRLPITGAAPIAPDTLYFFAGINLPLHELYGLSETSAPATANPVGAPRLGTIGQPLPGTEAKLTDDGELLLRGGNIFPGYYEDPDKTAEALDDDGWLHTGDVATIDPDGFITIVDRMKELIVTPGGKNISPATIEGLIKQHPLIGQACVLGDRRRYIAALIVLDAEAAPAWAASQGIAASDLASLAVDEAVRAEVERAIEGANEHLSQVEKVKRFTILPTEWTPDSEELTPTLKLKRRVIAEKYAEEIEALYAE